MCSEFLFLKSIIISFYFRLKIYYLLNHIFKSSFVGLLAIFFIIFNFKNWIVKILLYQTKEKGTTLISTNVCFFMFESYFYFLRGNQRCKNVNRSLKNGKNIMLINLIVFRKNQNIFYSYWIKLNLFKILNWTHFSYWFWLNA